MHSNSDRDIKGQFDEEQPLILIVDNDSDNLLFASYIVESMGMRYVVTDDSEKCLQLTHELLPDTILLDIVMPKMDGLAIIKLLKQDIETQHIPIIAVTGLCKVEEQKMLIESGFDDYLSKPYLIEELEAKIYRLLKHFLA